MKKSVKKKLVLGTANFGKKYGIRKLKSKKNYLILKTLLKNNVNWLDTSGAYTNSEKIIGNSRLNFNIISKNHFNFSHSLPKKKLQKKIKKIIEKSLTNLKRKKIYAFLIQKSGVLLSKNGEQIYEILKEYKKEKKILKIGVSTYNFKELRKIIKKFKIDIVQAPFNIVNDELTKSGTLNFLKRKKIEVHVRSIFLQGILLVKSKKLPKKLNFLKQHWILLEKFYKKNSLTPIETCLRFVLSFRKIDKIVFGVDEVNQLKQILKSRINRVNLPFPKIELKNKDILSPIFWSKLK